MGVRKTIIAAAMSFALVGAASARAQQPASSRAENDRLFRAAAELYSIDPDLLAAIASVESGGNSDAVSPKGAQGLMQLMPATANRFRVLDPFDPVSNTLGAVRFISFLRQYRTAHGDGTPLSLPEMLAAYNAGEGAVDKYNGIPPYPETQQYVRKVLIAYLFRNSHSSAGEAAGRASGTADRFRSAADTFEAGSQPFASGIDAAEKSAGRFDRQADRNSAPSTSRAQPKEQTDSRLGEPDGPR